MRRREFIIRLASATACPLAAGTQQPIGFLFYGTPEIALEVDAFRQGLRELGYIEGQNITVEYRFGMGQVGKLPDPERPALSDFTAWVMRANTLALAVGLDTSQAHHGPIAGALR